MLNRCETETDSEAGLESRRAAVREGLRALGADLSPELDAHLKRLNHSASWRAARSGVDVNRLLGAFASGSYSEYEFDAALAALDTSETGATSRSHLCAWLLGVPLLREKDRARAAIGLRDVLRKSTKSLITPIRKRMSRALLWTAAMSASLAVFGWIIGTIFPLPGSPSMWDEIAVFSSIGFFPVVLLCLRQREMEDAGDLQFIAAHALGRLHAVAATDALSAACLDGRENLSQMSIASLRVVLPHLTLDHYGQFGSETVPNLCRLLKRRAPLALSEEDPDYSFALELVDAIGKIGDIRAIPVVEYLAREWHDSGLVSAAGGALVFLEERKRRETERATLLRGAGTPAISNAELLRAATGRDEARPEQLLRPAE